MGGGGALKKGGGGGGCQNLQDSGGPFGLWRVTFSRGVRISKKEKTSSGIG